MMLRALLRLKPIANKNIKLLIMDMASKKIIDNARSRSKETNKNKL